MSESPLFRRKSIERLLHEVNSEQRLQRVLGVYSLAALGIGAIIGAGIFALAGRVAANDAGPAIMGSFLVAGVACVLAALCYSEFAAMVPVAGSAYTYTYATLGELFAWMIGWDLILEYGMCVSVVASHWTHYFDELLHLLFNVRLPSQIMSDPYTPVVVGEQVIHPWMNLPAMLILGLVTVILVIGIRESARTNLILVIMKVCVVLFVIVLGFQFIKSENWTSIPVESRKIADVDDFVARHPEFSAKLPADALTPYTTGSELLEASPEAAQTLTPVQATVLNNAPNQVKKWGLLGAIGIKSWLQPLDDAVRSPFFPYGLSGMMVGASLVFFAFLGFDSISTHAEEAVRPQRDVPIAILSSLGICTFLYMLMGAVITGMEPYPQIDTGAAIAAAFRKQAELTPGPLLSVSATLIAAGALAGMTSVLLVMFLSQSRIFLAMARDGLLPQSIFGVVHPKFRTPHRSTMLTGLFVALAAGFVPARLLEEMVSIGTLMAFVLVCASVMVLRITRPEVHRPFRCPALFVVAPLGMLVSITMMLFLPVDTWLRLVIWMGLGLVVYALYGFHNSLLRKEADAAASA